MPHVTDLNIPPGQEEVFYKNLNLAFRYSDKQLRAKTVFLPRSKKQSLLRRSDMPAIGEIWSSFTTEQKQAWGDVGAIIGQNGYRAFVINTCARLKVGLSPFCAPSLFHNGRVAELNCKNLGEYTQIRQMHLNNYVGLVKVAGKRGLYAPVEIEENPTVPISFSFSYFTDGGVSPENMWCGLYVTVCGTIGGYQTCIMQGVDCLELDEWKNASFEITDPFTEIISIEIIMYAVGENISIYFDNFKMEHDGMNWAFDSQCEDIMRKFTGQWSAVEPFWIWDEWNYEGYARSTIRDFDS